MRYLGLFFFSIFLLFAVLQLNDPDPVWWVTVYLVPAYISWRAYKSWFNIELLTTFAAVYLASTLNSLLQMTAYEGVFTEGSGWEMKTLNQELLREAGGTGIALLVCLVYLGYAYSKQRGSDLMRGNIVNDNRRVV
jgi:hypothetical protein